MFIPGKRTNYPGDGGVYPITLIPLSSVQPKVDDET